MDGFDKTLLPNWGVIFETLLKDWMFLLEDKLTVEGFSIYLSRQKYSFYDC